MSDGRTACRTLRVGSITQLPIRLIGNLKIHGLRVNQELEPVNRTNVSPLDNCRMHGTIPPRNPVA